MSGPRGYGGRVRHWLPRSLHPVSWWLFAIAMAAAASQVTNPLVLLLIIGAVTVVVLARRGEGPWAHSFRLSVIVGAFVVVMRVLYRVIFGGGDGSHVLFALPTIPLPSWVAGVRLLGPVSAESLLGGLYDGLRLATMIICLGAANALANPKRLLASVPGALYEVGAILVVAVSVFPQLGESVLRIRRARELRRVVPSGPTGRRRSLPDRYRVVRSIVVPVFADALDRSLSLAASMDARGYGRVGGATRSGRRTVNALILAALLCLCIGSYGILSDFVPTLSEEHPVRPLGFPMLVLGILLGSAGFTVAGRTVRRTRYRPDPWRTAETLVVCCGLLPAVAVRIAAVGPFPEMAGHLNPPLLAWPVVDWLPGLGILLALGAALLTPRPARTGTAGVPVEFDRSADAAPMAEPGPEVVRT